MEYTFEQCLADRKVAASSGFQGYQMATGFVVWWVNAHPYPSESLARRVADHVANVYGSRHLVTMSIESPEALRSAIVLWEIESAERRKWR
jgi:hypothetical protein